VKESRTGEARGRMGRKEKVWKMGSEGERKGRKWEETGREKKTIPQNLK